MPRSFALNDAWHRNQKNEFIWGKIVPDKAQKTSNLSHRGLTKSSSWQRNGMSFYDDQVNNDRTTDV